MWRPVCIGQYWPPIGHCQWVMVSAGLLLVTAGATRKGGWVGGWVVEAGGCGGGGVLTVGACYISRRQLLKIYIFQ